MSIPASGGSGQPAVPAPARRVIASYENYQDAQRAVDRLADAGFPVERAAIVGRGLSYVEQASPMSSRSPGE